MVAGIILHYFPLRSCEEAGVTVNPEYSLYFFPWVVLKRAQNVSNHPLYVLVASL